VTGDVGHTDISFVWKVVRGGDVAYVEEYVDDVLAITYGPMPADVAGPFIDDCKERLKDIFAQLMGD